MRRQLLKKLKASANPNTRLDMIGKKQKKLLKSGFNQKKKSFGLFSLCFTNRYFRYCLFDSVDFWQQLCHFYFKVDRSSFMQLKDRMITKQASPPTDQQLWKQIFRYCFATAAKWDTNPKFLSNVFQVKHGDTVIKRMCLQKKDSWKKQMAFDLKHELKSMFLNRTDTDIYATSCNTFSPGNVYYFEFWCRFNQYSRVGVGLMPNTNSFYTHDNVHEGNEQERGPFNATEYKPASNPCLLLFENQEENSMFLPNDTVGLVVDYSFSEKNVMKLYFCTNWDSSKQFQHFKKALERIRHVEKEGSCSLNDDLVSAYLLRDELTNIHKELFDKSYPTYEEELKSSFKNKFTRLLYFTPMDRNATEQNFKFPKCYKNSKRGELISFINVPEQEGSPNTFLTTTFDPHKDRPISSTCDLILPDFKLCMSSLEVGDRVQIKRPKQPYPPLYYHIMMKGKYEEMKRFSF